jgi:hypothetical protein
MDPYLSHDLSYFAARRSVKVRRGGGVRRLSVRADMDDTTD